MQRAAGGEAPGGGALGRSSSGGGAGAYPLRRTRTGDASRQLWLDAWADPVAGAGPYGGCVATCNLYGDGDWRLVVADVAENKLKARRSSRRFALACARMGQGHTRTGLHAPRMIHARAPCT